MGESKKKLAKRNEMLLSCSGVQTLVGRVQMRWDTESAVISYNPRKPGRPSHSAPPI